jgi:hypothetical protein
MDTVIRMETLPLLETSLYCSHRLSHISTLLGSAMVSGYQKDAASEGWKNCRQEQRVPPIVFGLSASSFYRSK